MPKKKATSSLPSSPPVTSARSESKKRTQTTQPTVTPFQKKVYAAASKIPPGIPLETNISLIETGYVSTYGAIAQVLGCKSAQAVGQALRRNPFAPTVPCHRVISADLCIGGFFGI